METDGKEKDKGKDSSYFGNPQQDMHFTDVSLWMPVKHEVCLHEGIQR